MAIPPGQYSWSPDPFLQFRDAEARPLAGGHLFTYVAGTSTPQTTYSDVWLTVANTNPINLMSDGTNPAGPVFLTPGTSYRYVLTDRDGNVQWTRDNIRGGLAPPAKGDRGVNTSFIAQGRLTLVSGDPANADHDTIGADTIYYTPYHGTSISLWDGADWQVIAFPETSATITNALVDWPYDVFGFLDPAGFFALEFEAWADASTRVVDVVRVDGVYVKSTDQTRRYLGSFCTTSATTTEDSTVRRYLYNANNHLTKALIRMETAAEWFDTESGVVRQANNNPLNKVSVMQGLQEDAIEVSLGVFADAVDVRLGIGIGIDQPIIDTIRSWGGSVSVGPSPMTVQLTTMWTGFLLGRRDILWLEYFIQTGASTVVTFWAAQPLFNSGLIGLVDC